MRNKKYCVILSVIAVIESVLLISFPFFTSRLVDNAIDAIDTKKYLKMYYAAGFVLGVSILLVIFRLISNALYYRFYVKQEKSMRTKLFSSLIEKKYKEISLYHQAEIDQLFTADIRHIIRKDLDTIPTFFRQVSRLILAVVYLLILDWKFLIVVSILGIIGFISAKLYSKIMKPRHKLCLETDGKASSFTIEAFEQIKLIESYEAEEYSKIFYDKLNEESANAKKRRNKVLFIATSGLYGFSTIIYALALCYGAYQISHEYLTYGAMIALVQLLSNIQNPLISFSPILNEINLAKSCEERINKALMLPEISASTDIKDFEKISFNDVSFSYSSDKEIINNLSFEINKGDIVLLKGPSGIGKTTLFMLMLGFLSPNSGSIVVNDKYDISECKSLFSYVPQENILFSGTIKDNIYILTGKDSTDAIEALKLANIYDELLELQGLDTVLKSRGAGLSIGQIQRILIAIAILRDAPILLLDEFSSALDKENEEIIINNLRKIGKTILYITHRDAIFEKSKTLLLEKNKDNI